MKIPISIMVASLMSVGTFGAYMSNDYGKSDMASSSYGSSQNSGYGNKNMNSYGSPKSDSYSIN